MYKKKLGVRVVTAITVGSLLCSNASVAMAAEEVSSIIKEHSDESNQSSNSTEVTVRINYYDKASGKKIGEDFEHVTVTEGEDPVVLNASDLENLTVDGVEYQVADTAEDCTVEYRENVSEVYWAVAMDKIEEPEVNSKDVTVRINYYDKASGKKIGEGYEHVTVTESEDPVVLNASDLENLTVDGVEYQVADTAKDCTVEYRENVSEVYWAVAMDKIEEPEVNSKDVTVHINYYDKASGKKIGEGYEHVTVTEGEDPVVLKAADLGTFTVDGIEYQVADDAVDCTVEYRENVSEVYWAVSMNKIEEPEVNSKDVTVRINYYDKASGEKIGEGYEHVTVTEGEDPVILKAADLGTFTVDGVEYQVADDAVDCTVEYRENVSEVYWAVSMNKIEKPQVNSKDVTVRINYYDKASGEKIGEGYEHVTVTEGEDPVILKAADLGTFTVDGIEYQVADDAVDCTVEYRENVSEVYWAVSMNKIEKPQVNSKDVTVRINYYDKASGEKIGEAFEHVTVAEGEDPVVLKAADLGTFTVDGVEYQVADDAVDCTVEYRENVSEVYWAVSMDKIEQPEANTKDVTVRIWYYNRATGLSIGEGFKHVTVTEGADPVILKAIDLENLTVDGVEYKASSTTVDCTVEYHENVDEIRWAVAMDEVETHRNLMVNYIIDMDTPVLSETIRVEKDQEFLKLDSLNIPAGYVLGDNGGDSIYIADLDSVFVYVKEKSVVDPEVNSKDVTIHIQYYLHGTGATLKKEDKVVTVKEGEEPTLLKAADLGTITVDGKEYRVHASAENLPVEYNENINEYQWAVAMEETATEPEETYADATLTVVYVDGKETVGTQVLKVNGLVGKEHTFTSKDLAVPENYEFVKAFAGHPVAYGAEDTVTVEVRKIELPTPDEKADATLHVSYIFNYKEIASEDITVRGKKGESYTFTADNLNIPSSYKLKKAMEPTEVQFGETYAITLELARRSSGGGSGSSGGGSGSGGGRSVSTAKKLTNGQWILDSTGWWYPFSDNTYAKGGWYYLEWQNKMDWYYFDNNGYLVSGWFEENGNKYYLHDVHDGTFGRMYLGWNKIGNQWYYFNDTTTGTFGALNPNAQVPAELLNQ